MERETDHVLPFLENLQDWLSEIIPNKLSPRLNLKKQIE